MKDPLDNFQSLLTRFAIIAISTLLIVAIASTGIYFLAKHNLKNLIVDDKVHYVEYVACRAATAIHSYEEQLDEIGATYVAQTLGTSPPGDGIASEALRSVPQEGILDIVIVDAQGMSVTARQDSVRDFSQEHWFAAALQGNGSLITDESPRQQRIRITKTITEDDQTVGAVMGEIDAEGFRRALTPVRETRSPQYTILINGRDLQAMGTDAPGTQTDRWTAESLSTTFPNESGVVYIEETGKRRMIAYARETADETDILALLALEDVGRLPALRNLRTALLAMMAAIVLGVIFALFRFERAFVRPVTALAHLAQRLSEGEDVESITKRRRDELHDLEVQIRWMATVYKNSEQHIQRMKAEERQRLETEINAKTKELRRMVEGLKRSRIATYNILEDLQEANKGLEEKDQVKTDFLNMISHELKTPLTPIKANLDMLRDGDFGRLTKKQAEALETLMRNTARLESIIHNLLEISRIEAGKMVLEKAKTDLNALIADIVAEFVIPCEKKGLTLSFSRGKIPSVDCDRERVKECALNYLNNALKFTERGGIVVTTRRIDERNASWVEISVADTGKGVGQDNLKNLFQKFYQEGRIEVGKATGVGLGLYSVRRIIEMHDGTVGVERLPQGSRFWFRLPASGRSKGGRERRTRTQLQEGVKKRASEVVRRAGQK